MANDQSIDLTTPVGRLVQGSVYEPNTTNMEGQPLVYKSGAQIGQPRSEYFIGIAVEKNNPDLPAFWQKLSGAARGFFPNLFDQQGNCTHPQFSFKMIDGDGKDTTGKPWSTREGFAGHYVFRLTSGYAPRLAIVDNGQVVPHPVGVEMIKRGHYVQAAIKVKTNNNGQKPGLHLNLDAAWLVGYGKEISSGVDAVSAAQAASANTTYRPQGMSAVPLAGAMPMIGQQPGAAPGMQMQPPGMQMQPPGMQMQPPGMQMQPPGMQMPGAPQPPAMQMQPPGMQMQTPPPQPGGFVAAVVGNALPPMPGAAPGMQMQPPGMQMQTPQPVAVAQLVPTANAQGHSIEAWRAQGYTDDQLVQNQIFIRQ